ncbi:hypothetical protein PPTG_24407 [Phytophthora nicotianae INRA-310]|uniref:DDE Tnp4 domain-containing protein n=3 Tax=Phytophthora nicotianae TaxID=4792 RepID=W2PFY2_PHYN3|nr:hypothetical protein PPTG_24407 [Phytophthora nicotianae INRA-310]ETM99550.1 hypothetical protein PPTG_24407 [Phytophthora nicotianae INRA-310]ETO59691.1 hypothetical protein F444_22012 [Phytophthora nicotianae P1976]
MVTKAKVAVLCVMQCIWATFAALSSDRRRFGGYTRKNVNTFASNAFDKAVASRRTKWFHRKMRCDRRTFFAIVTLVQSQWIGKIHHNTKHNLTKRVAVTMVYLASGGSTDNAATVLGMSKSSAVVYINQVLSVLSKMAKQKITLPSALQMQQAVMVGLVAVRWRFEGS